MTQQTKEEREREVPFLSEIETFASSPVWKYMAEEIASIMMAASVANEEVDPYKEPAALCRNQGVIYLGKLVLDMPKQLSEERQEINARLKEEEEE